MLCDRFTVEFGTPGMLKSMFPSSIARLNLFAFDDVVSRCSREPTSCTLCELAPQVSPFDRSVSFDTFFDVDLPCGILCNLLSSRTCDRVVGPS